MKSQAATVKDYLASLPEDRRAAVSTVRDFILDNLDTKNFVECMQYGVIAYCVSPALWPHGHHTNPKLGLMYMGLSSQKNDMVVYMLMLLHNEPERKWFDGAWKSTGRKNYLEVTGAGCCLRFKKVEDLSLGVIAEGMRRMTAKRYLEDHVAMLARIGRGPDGKAVKNGGRLGSGGTAKKAASPSKKPAARAKATPHPQPHPSRTTKKKRASSRGG